MAIGNIKLAGVLVGAGAALVGTIMLPALGGALKSLTKSLIKGGLRAYQGSKELVDQTTEAIDHIAAEAKAELKQSAGKQPPQKKAAKKQAPKSKPAQATASQ